MSRLVHGFNCKDDKPVIFSKRFFNNKYLIGAFVLGMILITSVLMIPGLHGMFKVVTLSLKQLMTVYGLALLNLPVIQGMKYLKREIETENGIEKKKTVKQIRGLIVFTALLIVCLWKYDCCDGCVLDSY